MMVHHRPKLTTTSMQFDNKCGMKLFTAVTCYTEENILLLSNSVEIRVYRNLTAEGLHYNRLFSHWFRMQRIIYRLSDLPSAQKCLLF